MTPHARSIVRIINYSWPPQPDVANAVASCSQCSREIKCRVECSDCLQCICLACHEIPERRQPWYRHREQHERIKGFIWLSPPLKNVVPPENYECECLTVTGCISHCERCSKGMLPSRYCRFFEKFAALSPVGIGIMRLLPANSGPWDIRRVCIGEVSATFSHTCIETDACTTLSTTRTTPVLSSILSLEGIL